jgi:hypothetical protein
MLYDLAQLIIKSNFVLVEDLNAVIYHVSNKPRCDNGCQCPLPVRPLSRRIPPYPAPPSPAAPLQYT